jgi:hypothetical protein
MMFRVAGFASAALLTVLAAALAACSSTSGATAAPAAETPDAAPAPVDDPSATPDGGGTDSGSACAPPPSKSTCGDNAWVRGTARFDPALLKAGSKPILRVVLRHGFTLVKGEETIGGRLHEWASFPVKDPTSGEVAFAIDMCGSGTAMWSEENGAFHLVLILDENCDNDLDNATSNEDAIVIGTPTKGEYAKMVDVDVSCKATAPACLDVKLDCTGESCLAFTPMKSCAKKLPGCSSDSSFCK